MVAGLPQFLADYPGMAVCPSGTGRVEVSGMFEFEATAPGKPVLRAAFALSIMIRPGFPRALPAVTEIGGKIPRDGHHHINPGDTLCLGSRLRLLMALSKQPDLTGYAERCLVPYLYAMTHKFKHGGPFVFDELAHGSDGVIADYRDMFRLTHPNQVRAAWHLLGLRLRRANKQRCPCGCARRLGRCPLHRRLASFRRLAPRSWFRRNPI